MIDVPVVEASPEEPPVASPTTTVREAARALQEQGVTVLAVREAAESVSGVVTESDVVAAVAAGGVDDPIGDYMAAPVETVAPERTVGMAADRMRKVGRSVLPIVDDDGAYHGVVTRANLAPYVSRGRLDLRVGEEPLVLDDPDATGVDVADQARSDTA